MVSVLYLLLLWFMTMHRWGPGQVGRVRFELGVQGVGERTWCEMQ